MNLKAFLSQVLDIQPAFIAYRDTRRLLAGNGRLFPLHFVIQIPFVGFAQFLGQLGFQLLEACVVGFRDVSGPDKDGFDADTGRFGGSKAGRAKTQDSEQRSQACEKTANTHWGSTLSGAGSSDNSESPRLYNHTVVIPSDSDLNVIAPMSSVANSVSPSAVPVPLFRSVIPRKTATARAPVTGTRKRCSLKINGRFCSTGWGRSSR